MATASCSTSLPARSRSSLSSAASCCWSAREESHLLRRGIWKLRTSWRMRPAASTTSDMDKYDWCGKTRLHCLLFFLFFSFSLLFEPFQWLLPRANGMQGLLAFSFVQLIRSHILCRNLGPVPHDASYYSKCMFGGALACGTTHAGITPLDVAKCNMQVC